MPLALKEIIRPGTYWHISRTTGKPEKLPVDAEYCRYLCDQGTAMLAAGLSIPVPLEHDTTCRAMNSADKAAADLKNNVGWVDSFQMCGDRLFAHLDVQDAATYKKLPRTIKFTSPWLNSFTDGNGKEWNGVISHVALTSRPRITQQEPFANFAAALSMASDGVLDKKLADPGIFISRAGLLDKEGNGFKPRYSAAFSVLMGPDFPPKKDDKAPPKKEGAPDAKGVPSKEGEKPKPGEGDAPAKIGAEGENGVVEGLEEEELDLAEIMCDLLSAMAGIDLPEDTNEENCLQNVLRALMDHAKTTGKLKIGDEPAPTPTKPGMGQAPSQPRSNPVLQEQAPMYMTLSLEDIQKITDPKEKSIAEAFMSLRNERDTDRKKHEALSANRLADFKKQRDQRIEKLCKRRPMLTDDLLAMSADAGFALSLADDGNVIDPMNKALAMLEKGLVDLPSMLLGQPSNYQEVAHPVEPGTMSKERVIEVTKELAKTMGVELVQA